MSVLLQEIVTETDQVRKFVRFPSAMALSTLGRAPPASRLMRELGGGRLLYPGAAVGLADLAPRAIERLRREGATLYDDVQFTHFPPGAGDPMTFAGDAGPPQDDTSLQDVVEQVRAPQAWAHSRGAGVTIAVVDSGICPTRHEIPAHRRSPVDPGGRHEGRHWEDETGHGSMCAVIAGGSNGSGMTGIAPEATILSARTDLTAGEISLVYGGLITQKRSGAIPGPLVISNSWGLASCREPPSMPADHPFLDSILQAIYEGSVVVFAAGNNHGNLLCDYPCDAAMPNTIWGANSHDQVLCVGTVGRSESNRDPGLPHCNSSRGPGQFASKTSKPDCVAPTYGRIAWACEERWMAWWGTSGACPQVAGLAALLLGYDATLTVEQVRTHIIEGCRQIPGGPTCVGRGIIDCEASMLRLVGQRGAVS